MAARRPFWNWRCWKSISFCPWPPSTCIWNLKLKFQSKLDLCSRNHVAYRQTDGRTDGQGESSIPPLQLRWVGGIIKTVFLDIRIPVIKKRWSWYYLIFTMGIWILVRWHLYIEMTPWIPFNLYFFQQNSNLIEISICSHFNSNNGLVYWCVQYMW